MPTIDRWCLFASVDDSPYVNDQQRKRSYQLFAIVSHACNICIEWHGPDQTFWICENQKYTHLIFLRPTYKMKPYMHAYMSYTILWGSVNTKLYHFCFSFCRKVTAHVWYHLKDQQCILFETVFTHFCPLLQTCTETLTKTASSFDRWLIFEHDELTIKTSWIYLAYSIIDD